MSDIAIRVENLSKLYHIGARQKRHDTLRDQIADFGLQIADWGKRVLKSEIINHKSEIDMIWALKDVSFEVKQGEVVGIIGRNGAGKSTLLKILSRITKPTSGHARLYGRVGSLLEVGTGFHSELTGRENIYLSGAIMGMKKAEIDRKFDEIVAFSEVEKFIDTPVKRYSSGMYVRLAFAVAAHLEPEILLVDEVLAVGDAAFQKKCLGKMGDVAKEGRTVLFVSHNMGALRSICQKAIQLDKGRIVNQGNVDTVVRGYLTSNSNLNGEWKRTTAPSPGNSLYIEEISVRNSKSEVTGHILSDEDFGILMAVCANSDANNIHFHLRFTNQDGVVVFTTVSTDIESIGTSFSRGSHRFEVEIPGNFLYPGTYTLILAVLMPRIKILDVVKDEVVFALEDVGNHATKHQDGRLGVVTPQLHWKESSN